MLFSLLPPKALFRYRPLGKLITINLVHISPFRMATSAYEASYKKYFGDRFDKITKNSSDEEVRNLYDKWAADYDKVSIIIAC